MGKKHRIASNSVDMVVDELYNQKIPIETPELLSSKLEELEEELRCIPNEKKKEYLLAVKNCPDIACDKKFRMMFLRCDIFNCALAAKRIVKYWAKRIHLFGESKAFLPMVLGEKGPLQDDQQALQYGMFQATEKRDSSGRQILFCDPTRLPVDTSKYDNESVTRATWYMAHAALQDETTQQKGVVIIIYLQNLKFAHFNPKLARMFAESFKGCIPVRLSSLHFCHFPLIFDLILPVIKVLMGAYLRKKIKLNGGGNDKLGKLFEDNFGIQKDDLPIEVGGSLELNHEKWIQQRLENNH